MANEKNLIPLNQRTKSEQREIARKGGKKSAENRRIRKQFKENMTMLLNSDVVDAKYLKLLEEIGTEDTTNHMLLVVALFNKAISGDVSAIKLIFSIVDEKSDDADVGKLEALLKGILNE